MRLSTEAKIYGSHPRREGVSVFLHSDHINISEGGQSVRVAYTDLGYSWWRPKIRGVGALSMQLKLPWLGLFGNFSGHAIDVDWL